MMTDRQRVEALFPLILFKSVVTSSGEQSEGNALCVAALDVALWDVLRTAGDQRKQASVYRRVERLHNAVMMPDRKGGITIEKAGLIGFHFLQMVLACGYLELDEGSSLAVAIQAILEAIDGAEARVDASAQKQARKMLQQLHGEGYFVGVVFEREVA